MARRGGAVRWEQRKGWSIDPGDEGDLWLGQYKWVSRSQQRGCRI